jgi:hypothetical protein
LFHLFSQTLYHVGKEVNDFMKEEKQLLRSKDWEMDIMACSATECTGLIPSLPQSEEEREHYEELYPYLTKAKARDNKNPSAVKK